MYYGDTMECKKAGNYMLANKNEPISPSSLQILIRPSRSVEDITVLYGGKIQLLEKKTETEEKVKD